MLWRLTRAVAMELTAQRRRFHEKDTTMSNTVTIILIGMAALVALWLLIRRWRRGRASIEIAFATFMRTRAAMFILISLVANTALAQLFFNSGGIILPSEAIAHGYLIASAVATSTALSLFELLLVHTLSDMTNSGISYGRWEWGKRILSLGFISLYNIYSLALLNYALWPVNGQSQHTTQGLPAPWQIGWADWLHAATFSGVLLLCGLVGEARRSAAEEVKLMEDEMLVDLLSDARQEVKEKKPGRALVALTALAPERSRAFFGNYHAILSGHVTIDDVTEHFGTAGIITPRAGRIGGDPRALNPPDDADDPRDFSHAIDRENHDEIDGPFSGDHEGMKGRSDMAARASDFSPDSPVFSRYILPAKTTLRTRLPLATMADLLGISAGALSEAFADSGMRWYERERNQPRNTKNLEVWQVLALVESGALACPERVRIGAAVTRIA